MRRLLIALIVVVGLLVVADRVAVLAADRLVANRIQTDQRLAERPDVSIHGFPFLTQAVGGRYDDVTLTMHDLHRVGVAVNTLSVALRGVHVPLSAVFSQRLTRVPVDRATATIRITYTDLDAFVGSRHLSVSPGPAGSVTVSGSITALGRTVTASGTGRLTVRGTDVVVTVGRGLDFSVPLGGLPFRISLVAARADRSGIVVTATASGLVLHPKT